MFSAWPPYRDRPAPLTFSLPLVSPPDRPDPPRTLGEAIAQNEALWAVIGEIREQFERVVDENEQLREELARGATSSRTSSKPPSSDSPAQKAARPKRKRSTRSKGAQPGHDRHERAALPESEVDTVSRYFPSGQCGCGSSVLPDTEPSCRHQVFDLPEVRYRVTEHQLFGGACTGCGKRHVAHAPQDVPSGQMGPGLIAWIAMMGGEMRLSVSQIQRLLHEQWKLSFSRGAISAAQGKASTAMARPYADIVSAARAAPVAHADETRHPRGGGGYPSTWWLWTLATNEACAFHVHYSRGMGAAEALLGEFAGTLVTDDYAGYNRVPPERRQLCWAHQLRHFAAIGERGIRSARIGRRLELIGRLVVRTRHRLDQAEIDERVYHRRMDRLRARFVIELERGARLPVDGRTRRQCEHLIKREEMLWTFLTDRRVPLTNNLAERAIRGHVLWRKVAYASHSRRGDEFRARMLSVVTTGRNLGVPIYEYLREICRESMRPEGVTTLLPLGVARLPA